MKHAAFGFRAHSGWAALVAVAGSPCAPEVLDRRRIELILPGVPRQPFHAAEGRSLSAAAKIIKRSEQTAKLLARRGLQSALKDLAEKGCRVAGCGLLLSSGRTLPDLAAILASHALIHTAEGELFRDALRLASKSSKLPLTGIPERELLARAAAQFRLAEEELKSSLTAMSRTLGSPWTQDEKYAALIGWLVLAAKSRNQ